MMLVPGLRNEMPVKYIPVPNTSATRTFRAGTITNVTNVFAQIVDVESYTCARRIPTPTNHLTNQSTN